MTSKMTRPPNVGTSADIPDDLCNLAHIQRNNVVAWVTLDEKYEGTVGHVTCCATFGVFLVLPCFWPHLLIIWPCLLAGKLSAERVIRNTYWILTATEIKVIVKSHSGCCGTNGDQIKSIPLDTITDCGLSAKSTACGQCYEGVPTIYIDTASSGARSTDHSSSSHEAVGFGLAGYDWFMAEILARRDTLKGHNTSHHLSAISSPSPSPLLPIAFAEMERGDKNESSTVESRLQKIKDLRNLARCEHGNLPVFVSIHRKPLLYMNWNMMVFVFIFTFICWKNTCFPPPVCGIYHHLQLSSTNQQAHRYKFFKKASKMQIN